VRVVEPSVNLDWITSDALEVIERAGRTCYMQEIARMIRRELVHHCAPVFTDVVHGPGGEAGNQSIEDHDTADAGPVAPDPPTPLSGTELMNEILRVVREYAAKVSANALKTYPDDAAELASFVPALRQHLDGLEHYTLRSPPVPIAVWELLKMAGTCVYLAAQRAAGNVRHRPLHPPESELGYTMDALDELADRLHLERVKR